MKFVVVIRGRNCGEYIDQCVHSVAQQDVDWRIHMILDPSKDDSWFRAAQYVSDRVKLTCNEKRQGVGKNMYFGIRDADAGPEDIIVILDADDYLLEGALEHVQKVYTDNPDIMCTYGSFILACTGSKSRICKPYKKIDKVRKAKWRATHLKTGKMKIFSAIPYDYLNVGAASDLALMFSAIELANLRNCAHIPKPLYYYRNSTKHSVARNKQRSWEKKIRRMKPLKEIYA